MRILLVAIPALALMACSSGKDGGFPFGPGYPASEAIHGKITDLPVDTSRDLNMEVSQMHTECSEIDGFADSALLSVGTKIQKREDDFHSDWGGNANLYNYEITEIIEDKKKYKMNGQEDTGSFQINAIWSLVAGEGYHSSRLEKITSTNPGNLMQLLDRFRDDSGYDESRSCNGEGGPREVTYKEVIFTMKSGREVRGILEQETQSFENYKCEYFKEDEIFNRGPVLRTQSFPGPVVDTRMVFLSKELIDPTEGRCGAHGSLLSMEKTTAANGKVIRGYKNETLSLE